MGIIAAGNFIAKEHSIVNPFHIFDFLWRYEVKIIKLSMNQNKKVFSSIRCHILIFIEYQQKWNEVQLTMYAAVSLSKH